MACTTREGVGADELTARAVGYVFLAVEKDGNIVMEPATSVVTGIDHYGIAIAVFADRRS